MAAGAWLLAVSPAMVFYSRMYIQEPLFAGFTLAFVIALGRVVMGGGLPWYLLAGLAAGLTAATKETSVIVLPAALAACAIAWRSVGREGPWSGLGARSWWAGPLAGIVTAGVVAALFYSSFLRAPGGILEPFRGAGTYLARGVEPAAHAHPWSYYVSLLGYSSSGGLRWSEGVVLALAVVGAVAAWVRPDQAFPARRFWGRYLSAYALLATAVFSAIPYKTPWNLLPFYAGVIVVAGLGFSRLVHATTPRLARAALVALFATACGHLGWQAWRASVTYTADPRNPYVYAQTVPDTVRMTARIRDLAAIDPNGVGMQVSVIASPYEQWPMPWYLRAMPNVGYWTSVGDPLALQAPVIVAAVDQTPALDAALGDRYVSEFHGLRPGVLLALYIERGLWDRYLAQVAEHCGQGPAVAMWRSEP